ncbi:MAG: Ig-like domain-containing protein, partial [Pseudoflavonifractor sp.]
PATFTRGDALDVLDGAVATKVKNQTYTLLEKLISNGAVTQEQMDKAAAIVSGTTKGKSDLPAGTYTLGCMGNDLRIVSDKLVLQNTSPAQKFIVISADGYSYIQTTEGYYVGVTSVDQGTQPVLGTTPYSWLIQKISNGVYTIRPAEKPEMLVCSSEASSRNGAQMLLWPHSDNAKHGLITFTDATKNVAVTGIKLDQTIANLTVGKKLQLTGSISPANASNQTVTWTSGASSVAQVNSDGLVTAMKAGTTIITAKTIDGSKTAKCTVTVTSDIKLIKSTVNIRNQTGKSITDMYITDSTLAKYDSEFLKESGYNSLSHNKYFTGKFEFYTDSKFDILLRFADGSEAEALGLSFSKVTSALCDLTLSTKEAILTRNGVTLARVNFESKANPLAAQSKVVTDRYNKSIARYNTLIAQCEKLKLDQDPAFVKSMNAVIIEVNKMGTAIGDGTHVLTAAQIKEFTTNLNDLDTFMTEIEALIKSATAKPDMTAESNKAIAAYDAAVTAYNQVVAAANQLNLGANAEVKKIVNQMSATMTEMTAAIEARVAAGTPFTAEQVTHCNGVTADLKNFTKELQKLVDAAKAEASKPSKAQKTITIINNTGETFSLIQ